MRFPVVDSNNEFFQRIVEKVAVNGLVCFLENALGSLAAGEEILLGLCVFRLLGKVLVCKVSTR